MALDWIRTQGDFTFPHGVRDAQFCHQVLPPWASSLLAAEIFQHLLSSVYEQSQVAQVVFVLLVHIVRQRVDLRGQDRCLHFRGAGVTAYTGGNGRGLGPILRVDVGCGVECRRLMSGRFGREVRVSIVSAEFFNTPLDVDTRSVFGGPSLERGDNSHCRFSGLVRAVMALFAFFFHSRISCGGRR